MPHRTPARRTVHLGTARGRLATVVLTATAAVALVACGGGTDNATGAGGPATTAPTDAVTRTLALPSSIQECSTSIRIRSATRSRPSGSAPGSSATNSSPPHRMGKSLLRKVLARSCPTMPALPMPSVRLWGRSASG